MSLIEILSAICYIMSLYIMTFGFLDYTFGTYKKDAYIKIATASILFIVPFLWRIMNLH